MTIYTKVELTPKGKKFWGTKRNSLTVVETDKPVSCTGGYWDGGSKSDWYIVTDTGNVVPVQGVKTNPFDAKPTAEVAPSERRAVLCDSTFRGKKGFLTVYILPGTKEQWTW
jgi:hypothetical protein